MCSWPVNLWIQRNFRGDLSFPKLLLLICLFNFLDGLIMCSFHCIISSRLRDLKQLGEFSSLARETILGTLHSILLGVSEI
uniref:Uncharacterized protein n=1 Tax=Aegilops tauschii subsp. strangulata TaxID=200361 RepID=A0A453DNF8_AEGTS